MIYGPTTTPSTNAGVHTVAHWRVPRPLLLALFLGVALLGLARFASGAQAAETASPSWRIAVKASPTNFIPGDHTGKGDMFYVITVANVGGEASNGSPITITDNLPSGLTVATELETGNALHAGYEGPGEMPCEVGPPVSCSGSSPVGAGVRVYVFVPVDVAEGLSGSVTNLVEVSGGGAPPVQAEVQTPISSERAPPGIESFHVYSNDQTGAPSTQAGSHPYLYHIDFQTNTFNENRVTAASGSLKKIVAELPPGVVLNPLVTPAKCTEPELESETCPDSSSIGIAHITAGIFGVADPVFSEGLFNMVTPEGAASSFGFNAAGLNIYIHILGRLNSSGNYVLTGTVENLPQLGFLSGFWIDFWGNPTDPSHDRRRGACATEASITFGLTCPVPPSETPEVTLPSACSNSLSSHLSIASWEDPGNPVTADTLVEDENGEPTEVDGCGRLEFSPTITAQATTNAADSPTGLNFNLHQPQTDSYDSLATASLKTAKVTLPEGLTINPSAGSGLSSCSNGQIGFLSGESGVHFSEVPQTCPAASKLGTAEARTPLVEHPLEGAIYLAKPYENPAGSLLAIYLVVEDEETGIVSKLLGKVEPDPVTGRLTTTFEESPQLPLEDVNLHFFEGARAPLKTPVVCGTSSTTSTLTPWSTPEGQDVHPSSPFTTSASASGSGACPTSEAAAPGAFSFSAGTQSPLSGTYSPFTLRLARANGTQHITGIDTMLPEGLTGKLAGIPYCSEADIALARSREAPEKGKEEMASPSCPAATEVGTVHVTAGAGISPVPVNGHAYLAGPYKGAPISLVTIVPAVVGPFDLGDVVTRVALNLGEYDARIHADSDPLPTIIDGIPVDLRSLELNLERPSFTLNPTSCETMAIEGSATTEPGQTVPLKNSFQVGECKRLAFKPKLALSLKGPTKRTGHPALKAVLNFPTTGPSANIASAQVGLPHGEFLDNSNIGTVCTQPQLKTQTCPPASIYGKAKAWTPLLDKPLEGPVYLGAGFGHKLPDLVADLNGQIRILVHGKVDTDKRGGIRNTFEAVPDAPVSKFVLEMQGGNKKGLLVNSENVCRKEQKAEVKFTAQNGKVLTLNPKIANSCKGGKGKKGGGKKGKSGKKGK